MPGEDEAPLTDGELLERFATARDEAAFEVLLRRHGPMVFGVCRRVLQNEADAEDAFQATFLVLVRKAASIRPRGMVGNWLYGVAHSTALKARAMTTKRLTKEREAAAQPGRKTAAEAEQQLRELLDQELKALPDKYRAVIVLCDLEGKSIKEAAQQLGCPPGTVGTRLARGRSMLARRLARHGLALSGAVIATLLSQNAASASVPSPLLASTVKAASGFGAGQATAGIVGTRVAALTEAVLKAMLLAKLKIASCVLLGITLMLALGGLGTVHLAFPSASAHVSQLQAHPDDESNRGPLDGVPQTVVEKPELEVDAGPPAKVPPDDAGGKKLADFIEEQRARGLRGEALADAIKKERARLGLIDEEAEPENAAPRKDN
jgi:RNA polymerase sigma factor (sigma-70 family)